NAETAGDFSTAIPGPPLAPTALGQFQSDGVTAIPVGGTGRSRSAVFKATVTDPNPGDVVRLEVEVDPLGTAFSGVPNGSGAGAAITPAVQVAVQDALGNTVTSFSGTITVTPGVNLAGGTLAGHTTVTAVNGVATFSDLSIDKVGTGYTLQATGAGLTTASASFDITPG